jgi:hypothetical protein
MSSDHLKETTMKPRSTASILTAVAVASFASIALLAPIHQAIAAKGGNARAATTGTAAPTPSPVARDHRGQPQTLPAQPYKCARQWCGHPGATVRDHRGGK